MTGVPAAFIELRGIGKDYVTSSGLVRALRGVDLDIERGELVAVIGTSGSGKSTLMHLLGCLDRPTRGSYRLAGVEMSQLTPDERALVRNRLLGFVFQAFNLLPRTTAHDNCEAPLNYRDVSAPERKRLAAAALAAVGLSDRGHHFPDQLSGGQQQRVTIARALVTNPPLLLADEPTGNLDTRTSYEVLALLQALNAERGVTVVLVTHEPEIAACAKRVITMRDGSIVSDEVNAQPVSAAERLLAPVGPATRPARPALEGTQPVRFRASDYFIPALWAWFGVGAGCAYSIYFLGRLAPWIPAVTAALLSAWAAARASARQHRPPLEFEDQARLSFGVTLLWVSVVWLSWLAFGPAYTPDAVIERLAGARAPELLTLTLLGAAMLGGLMAAHHGLASWLAPRQSP